MTIWHIRFRHQDGTEYNERLEGGTHDDALEYIKRVVRGGSGIVVGVILNDLF